MMKLFELKSTYKLFVDMDGVVSDFQRGVKAAIGEDYSEEKYKNDQKYKEKMWDLVRKYQDKGNELWYGLPLMEDAMDLWNFIKPYNPTFLTATGKTYHEETKDQKKRWIKEKFGKYPSIMVHSAEDKYKHAGENHILIDDKERATKPWEKAGGIGVIHTSAADTIKQLKKIGLQHK